MVYSNYTNKPGGFTDATPQTQKIFMLFFLSLLDFTKDIGLLVEGDNRDNDSLGLDVFQVGLGQHSQRLAATILGEDECIPA